MLTLKLVFWWAVSRPSYWLYRHGFPSAYGSISESHMRAAMLYAAPATLTEQPSDPSPSDGADVVMCVCCGKPAIGKCEGPSDPSPTALPGWVENALDRSPATRREILRTGELASQFGWTDTSPTAPAPDVREAMHRASEAEAEAGRLSYLIKEGIYSEYDDKMVSLSIMDESEASIGMYGPVYLALADTHQIIPSRLFEAMVTSLGDNFEKLQAIYAEDSTLSAQPAKAHIINPLNHEQTK